jgi:hypothetical protein
MKHFFYELTDKQQNKLISYGYGPNTELRVIPLDLLRLVTKNKRIIEAALNYNRYNLKLVS